MSFQNIKNQGGGSVRNYPDIWNSMSDFENMIPIFKKIHKYYPNQNSFQNPFKHRGITGIWANFPLFFRISKFGLNFPPPSFSVNDPSQNKSYQIYHTTDYISLFGNESEAKEYEFMSE